jgi:diaminopimelate epimerase
VEVLAEDKIRVRTYERGVEDETYSCGTGVVASAIAYVHQHHPDREGTSIIEIETKGGSLEVSFVRDGSGSFSYVWLIGPAERVFRGELQV